MIANTIMVVAMITGINMNTGASTSTLFRNQDARFIGRIKIDRDTVTPVDSHDDVIKWKHFRVADPLRGESTSHQWIPLTKASAVVSGALALKHQTHGAD